MPSRICIGCRTGREKGELVRLVRYGDRAIVDYSGKLPGRGAYVCPRLSCIEGAVNKRRLERALKSEKPLNYPDLRQQIGEAICRRILSLLGIAAKAGELASGWNEVRARWRQLKLILIAEDASENVMRRFSRSDKAWVRLTKAELGKAIGKPPRSVVGLSDPRLAAGLERELRRYEDVHPGD